MFYFSNTKKSKFNICIIILIFVCTNIVTGGPENTLWSINTLCNHINIPECPDLSFKLKYVSIEHKALNISMNIFIQRIKLLIFFHLFSLCTSQIVIESKAPSTISSCLISLKCLSNFPADFLQQRIKSRWRQPINELSEQKTRRRSLPRGAASIKNIKLAPAASKAGGSASHFT